VLRGLPSLKESPHVAERDHEHGDVRHDGRADGSARHVSDNIANVNTKGYVRKTIAQSNLLSNGMGVGVSIDAIKRATDRFMQSASLNAGADSARAGIVATTMNNAQQLFGDPSGETSFFSTLDDVYSAFSSAQDDPSSTLLRTQRSRGWTTSSANRAGSPRRCPSWARTPIRGFRPTSTASTTC
jgi:hypothetical protein